MKFKKKIINELQSIKREESFQRDMSWCRSDYLWLFMIIYDYLWLFLMKNHCSNWFKNQSYHELKF
jgi:hypothetical protein